MTEESERLLCRIQSTKTTVLPNNSILKWLPQMAQEGISTVDGYLSSLFLER
ncbi:hypothetical protein O5466_00685 [Escherichia coli]|nr:hypothetical protein [Escherichia coli]